jgi:hypothetical protein
VGSPLQDSGVEVGNAPRRLLVVGVERSGTTWVAETLSHAPGAVYVHEPDNPFGESALSALTRHGTHVKSSLGLYPVLAPGEERDGCDSYRRNWDFAFAGGVPATPRIKRLERVPLLQRPWDGRIAAADRKPLPDWRSSLRNLLVGAALTIRSSPRQQPDFVIAKTVHATFALEWLVGYYQPEVIVLRRNPMAIVASVLHLFDKGYEDRLYWLYEDPRVQKRFIEPLGLPVPPKRLGRVPGCAWWLGFHCSVLAAVTSKHPDWVVVDHDQFARQSGPSFQELFRRVNLPWSDDVDRHLEESNKPGKGTDGRRTGQQATERWRTILGDDAKVVQGILDLFPPLST